MRYVIRRLASGVLMLLALTFVTYAVFFLIPWDPGHILAGPNATKAQLAAADHKLGVDRPIYAQYGSFLWRLVHGDLGHSFLGVSINDTIASAGPVTGLLVLGGGVVLLLLAVPLALLSALRARTLVDRAVLTFSILGIALHPFVVGVVLKQIFGIELHLLPAGEYCPLHHVPPPSAYELEQVRLGRMLPTPCHHGPWLLAWFEHMILPWLTFALFFLPFYVRIIRSRLIDTLGEPHVLTARAKGASELRILTRHVLRATLATVLAMLAIDLGTSITAAIYVEATFRLPGLGVTALGALAASPSEQGYDLPIVVGIVFVIACAVVVLNVAADVGAALLDPRARASSS